MRAATRRTPFATSSTRARARRNAAPKARDRLHEALDLGSRRVARASRPHKSFRTDAEACKDVGRIEIPVRHEDALPGEGFGDFHASRALDRERDRWGPGCAG